ncbi:MAG: hypothetical protein JNL43_11025 [Flavobacteriales bacterium]|nr:hypothetical protein [Flavobacteriales bacterium]
MSDEPRIDMIRAKWRMPAVALFVWAFFTVTAQDRSGFTNVTSVALGSAIGQYTFTAPGYFGANSAQNEDDYKRVETVFGWWVKDGTVTLGLGIGWEQYAASELGASPVSSGTYAQLPLFFDLRIHATRGKTTPFLLLQAGHSFGIQPFDVPRTAVTSTTTLLAQPVPLNGEEFAGGLGLLSQLSDQVGFQFSFAYDHQVLNCVLKLEDARSGYIEQHYGVRFNALRISAGLVF